MSTPVTDKDTEEGEGGGYKYGASAMQGWRRSMEDEHIVLPSLRESGALAADAECVVPDAAMFAVFDGHGGKEVAKFCKKYMPGELAKSPDFREGNLEVALIKVYPRLLSTSHPRSTPLCAVRGHAARPRPARA